MAIQAWQSIKQNHISKITDTKRARGISQVVEDLPSKAEALNSITKKKKKKKSSYWNFAYF
jgi:hypothetical protein